MVYKLINEWKGIEELGEHEITVYKYNLNHDEMVRYFYNGDNVRKETFSLNSDPLKTEYYESKVQLTDNEKALVLIGRD